MEPIWNPPAYVITVPKVVPSGSDDDSSEGEEADGTFPDHYFKRPPYEIAWNVRGTVLEKNILKSSRKKPYKSEFIQKVEEESFKGDRAEAIDRVAVVIGHNRMLSISNSVNRSLRKQLECYADSAILSRDIHFYWRPQWVNTETGKNATCLTVRNFYAQFKKRNPKKARTFRREREGITDKTRKGLEQYEEAYRKTKMTAAQFFEKSKCSYFTRKHIEDFEKTFLGKGKEGVEGYLKLHRKTFIIPYREIRETIKNHSATKECVEKLAKKGKRTVYMAIQDADVESMSGIFLKYDEVFKEHLQKHKVLPEVASGGYKVNDPKNPILEVGVLIDLFIRHFTAQEFPTAVYFPEPNSMVKVKEGESTLEASFLGSGKYVAPQEMPTLIQDLIKKRNITNLSAAFLFHAGAAIGTAIPERMQRSFKAFYTDRHKIVRWGLSDLKIYKAISQTHYSNRSWAINICDAIKVPSNLKFGDVNLPQGTLRNMAISLTSRLFATYDPFQIARTMFVEARESKIGFQKTMKSVLKNYNPQNLPLAHRDEEARGGKFEQIWKEIDQVKGVNELIQKIDWIFSKPGIGAKIQRAAQQSMQAVSEIFMENLSLDFIELSIAAMMSLDKPRDLLERAQRFINPPRILTLEEIGSSVHQKVLDTMSESDWVGKNQFKILAKSLPEEHREGYLDTYPMHWAAITGNVDAVKFLKSINSWVSTIDHCGSMGLLPLHCAIRYCADNGESLELIAELATKELLSEFSFINVEDHSEQFESWTNYKIVRESPLLQALEEIYHYPKTIKLILDIAEVPQVIREELFDLVREMNEDQEEDHKVESKKILAFAIQKSYSPQLINCLLRWGADFHSCQDLLERNSPYSAVIDEDYRNESDRLELLEVIVDAGYPLNLEDNDYLTPLQYALEQENLPVVEALLKHLSELGYEPPEEEALQIEQLRQSTTRPRIREEPLDARIVETLRNDIKRINIASNLTEREKSRMIQETEWLIERLYHYSDETFLNNARWRNLS